MAIALLLLALLLPGTSIAAPLPAAQRARLVASGKIGHEVIAGLDTQGQIRVMVALAVPELQQRAARGDRAARRESVRRVRERVLHRLRRGDFTVTHRFAAVGAVAGTVTSSGLAALADDPAVVRIDVDTGGHAQLNQAVPLSRLDVVQDLGFTGKGVTVAIIDSGAHNTHPDLADSIVAEHCFCEACALGSNCQRLEPCCPDGTSEQDGRGSAQDDNGHGTNVTGIVTSNGDVAPRGGAPDAQIVSVKVLDSTAAFATSAQVVSGLDWLLDTRPDVRVVNMSLGTNARYIGDCDVSEPENARVIAFTEAINALHASGVAVFASSGNQQSGNSMPLPACVAASISVGAVWDSDVGRQSVLGCVDSSTAADQVTCFSNSNTSTDVFAPGGPMTSTGLNDPTSTFRGTSQSSPAAAACAALLLEAHPDLTPDEIETALETSPVMVTDTTNGLSFPRVDCEAALVSLGPVPPTRSPTPSATITPTGSPPPTATETPTVTHTSAPSVTPSLTSTRPPGTPCAGDCDDSFTVSINELVLGVNIALEREPVTTCRNLDRDGSGTITIDELVMSVNNALRNCA